MKFISFHINKHINRLGLPSHIFTHQLNRPFNKYLQFKTTRHTNNTYSTHFLFPQQNDWPDCERLAANMHFHFPECQKIDFNALISRASASGIQLLEQLLQWDPERRPTAQQTLKYPFFQILVRTTDTGYVSLPDTQISHHNNDFNTRQTARVMRYGSLDNEQWAKETAEFGLRLSSSKQALLGSGNASTSQLSGDILKKNPTENGNFSFGCFVLIR